MSISRRRIDQTRLTTQRRVALSMIKRYFKLLLSEIKERISTTFVFNSIVPSTDRLRVFIEWLRGRLGLSGTPGIHAHASHLIPESELSYLVKEAYSKGLIRSFRDVNSTKYASRVKELTGIFRLAGIDDSTREFLDKVFSKSATSEKLKVLALRTFSDIKGVTEFTATNISRILSDAMIQGTTKRDIVQRISDTLNISISRASTIVNTEITRAHAEGQLDALDNLGVSNVGIAVEWDTVKDDRVCPLCTPLDGVVLRIEEARGLLPRHPNCRCAFVPTTLPISKSSSTPNISRGKSTPTKIKVLARKRQAGQKRQKREVERAISRSKRAEKKRTKREVGWGPKNPVLSRA